MVNNINGQPGAVFFHKVQILKQSNNTALDIISQVDTCIIYEDLFSPYISGELKIRDTLDLPNQIGAFGPDLLRLKINNPGDTIGIDGLFFIYKLADRKLVKDRTQTYTLYFTAIEVLADINSHISRRYNGTCASIITKILKEHLDTPKTFTVDEEGSNLSYVSNFWTPSRNFNYITEVGYTRDNQGTLMFYENRDGFNFYDIRTLLGEKNKTIQNFVGSDYSGIVGETDTLNRSKVTKDMKLEYANILGIRADLTYDIMKDYFDGAITTKLYSNDPVTKQIRWGTFNATDMATILNKNRMYPDGLSKLFKPIISDMNRVYGSYGLKEGSNYSRVQYRTAIMRTLQSSQVHIDVHGRLEYTVGRKVNLNLNQIRDITMSEDNADIVDKIYSANYLITAVVHTIARDGHRTTLELSKESSLQNG
jgi:hypothetical protein